MKERIKQLRKLLKLSQVEFGKSIGVKGTTVSNWESGFQVPNVAISSICKVHNIRREWLEKGEGDVHSQPTLEETRQQAFLIVAMEIYEQLTDSQKQLAIEFAKQILERDNVDHKQTTNNDDEKKDDDGDNGEPTGKGGGNTQTFNNSTIVNQTINNN